MPTLARTARCLQRFKLSLLDSSTQSEWFLQNKIDESKHELDWDCPHPPDTWKYPSKKTSYFEWLEQLGDANYRTAQCWKQVKPDLISHHHFPNALMNSCLLLKHAFELRYMYLGHISAGPRVILSPVNIESGWEKGLDHNTSLPTKDETVDSLLLEHSSKTLHVPAFNA